MSGKKYNTILVTLCILLGLGIGVFAKGVNIPNFFNQNATTVQSNRSAVVPCTLKRVVDGDTLEVLVNNETKKVRLIGVDTPESVSSDESKNCEEGKIASDYTKSVLQDKTTLYMSKDKSDTDRYGRLLRFVWLEEPSETPNDQEIQEKMLNAILVQDGYAQAKDYKPDVTLSALFHQLGEIALQNGLGVSYKWKEN